MRELRYYSGLHYAEPSGGLEPSARSKAPFDEVYCVDLGDDLDEDRFEGAGERLADYLFAATIAPERTFFEARRAESARTDFTPELAALAAVGSMQKEAETVLSPSPEKCSSAVEDISAPCVKSFGICRLELSRGSLPREWIDYFCRKAADHWRGADHVGVLSDTVRILKNAADTTVLRRDSEPLPENDFFPRNFLEGRIDPADLFERACARSGVKSKLLNENDFHKMLSELCLESSLGNEGARRLSSRDVFHVLDEYFGPARTLADWRMSPAHSLQKRLLEALHDVAGGGGQGLADRVLKSSGPLPGGCFAAQAAIKDCMDAIRREDEKNIRKQERLREILLQSEKILTAQDGESTTAKKSWRQLGRSAKNQFDHPPCWWEYAELHRDLTILQAAAFILQTLRSELCGLGDRLRDLQHDLHKLCECFPEDILRQIGMRKNTPQTAPDDDPRRVDEQLGANEAELVRRCLVACQGRADHGIEFRFLAQ